MKWRSNSVSAIVAAQIMLIAAAALTYATPSLGSFLLLCSAVPILLLVMSAIHWAVREKTRPEIAIPAALTIVMIFGALLCASTPEQPRTLTQDDLETIHLGLRFEDIAREFGGGNWISDAEAFTVRYEVEGDMQLVLVFEDGIILSSAIFNMLEKKCGEMDKFPTQGIKD